jgi:TolA-binding protein
MPKTSLSLAFAFFVSLGMTASALAQTIHLPPAVSQSQSTGTIPVRSGDEIQKEQMRRANELRREEIKRDMEKLFQLSSELREFVEKDQGVLSLDAIKKAEQMEKLAHSVKTKMKQSY